MTASQACPLCGATKIRKLYALPDPDFATVRCQTCHFTFMSPYPTDSFLNDYYRSRDLYGFDGVTPELYARAVQDRVALFEMLFRQTGLPIGARYAVDFGAGTGLAVAALKRLGFDAVGIEKNPRAAAIGRDVFGVDILDVDFHQLPRQIDLLTMFDVLEHIKYPKDFLAGIGEKLSAGAAFVGAVPNYASIARILHGTKSISLVFPEHVNQFTRQSLHKTLIDSGFDVLYIGFPPPYGFTITLHLRARLRRVLGDGRLMKAIARLLVVVKKYVLYPVPNWLAAHTDLMGQSLVFVARRKG